MIEENNYKSSSNFYKLNKPIKAKRTVSESERDRHQSVSGGLVPGKEGAGHLAFTLTTGNRKLRRTATKRAQKQKSAYL